ncbi:permease-like cell division protein FtsX [Nonomuraea sp. B1E8]|uniref:permease-like cell division protein FtsX n=1 Tax=unclassified Nonomuraea TaxID=2593643 RepID=UPI00325ECD8A
MNHSPIEDRLREALTEAGATLDPGTLRPLRAPERRFRPNRRLVAAAAAVVLAGAATAAVLGGPGDVNSAVATNPETLPIEETDLAVFLCTESAPEKTGCHGRAATPEEVRTTEERLRELPQVDVVAFVSQEVAYEQFQQEYAQDKTLLAAVKPADMPPSFRVKTKGKADVTLASRALQGLPVVNVGDIAADRSRQWNKYVDVSVFLCQDGSGLPACGGERTRGGKDSKITEEGKGATAAQIKAVKKLIEGMPEVESFVFETQVMAWESFRKQHEDNRTLLNATTVEDMPESFRLTLRRESDAAPVVDRLKGQPGVATAVDHTCAVRQLALMNNYGLVVPDDKVCLTKR